MNSDCDNIHKTFTLTSLKNKQKQQRAGEAGKKYHPQAKVYLKLMTNGKRKISRGELYRWKSYGRTLEGENII